MCINSFGDMLIYILRMKVLFQREEVGKGWKGRKIILFKYFTIHSKSSYVLSPYSLVDLTPPLIKSHMVIPSCQATFISSKNPQRSCLMGLLQYKNHRFWVDGGCLGSHSYVSIAASGSKGYTISTKILLWLDVRKTTHNQPKVFSEHPLNLSGKVVQTLLIIYVLFKTQMKSKTMAIINGVLKECEAFRKW